MTVMEEKRNQTNVEAEGAASTETDDSKAMPSRVTPMLTQKSLAEQLPTSITNVPNDASAQGLQVLSDVSVCPNSRNGGFERVKDSQKSLVEKMNLYKTEKKKL